MTIGGKLATMERDCQGLVAALNKEGEYRGASQVQNLFLNHGMNSRDRN